MFRRYGTNARHRYKASDNTQTCALPTGAESNNINMARHRDSGAETPALVKRRTAAGNNTKDGNA
jgi:hypothetical protein